MLNLVSLLIIALGVFISPILAIGGAEFSKKAFGLALLLLIGYTFALAGHYELYNRHTSRSWDYCPRQEQVVLGLVVLAAVGYVVVAIVRS